MGQIVVLDQNMINMIAAGEVIERPASVVKELIENSIDSGATRITVSIEDGGRKLISVTDDGLGMDTEDLTNAFEPHATSKIKTSSDLHTISTLGFRGEALASIASIAHVKTVSRQQGCENGNCIEIDCGDRTDIGPCSADYGTTIQVRDLFYKLPARRKFLKTANTEFGHISEQFTRIALANANLDLTLIHNGREIYRLPSGKSLCQRITELFSSEIAENLIETKSEEKGLNVFAMMGMPEISKTNNKFQYIFLNGRFIRDKFIAHAIKEAYRGHLEPNRYPVTFLFIEMSPEDFDVNVHPTKIEVRFYNSNLVHSQILGCLREKLLGTDLDVEAKIPISQFQSKSPRSAEINDAMSDFFRKYRPSQSQHKLSFQSRSTQTATIGAAIEPAIYHERLKAIQIHDSFIIVQTDEGFSIIDQHALHERIMYEDLQARISGGKLESQKLLIPETFELTDAEAQIINSNTELTEKLGIELAPFGPKTYACQAFPTLLGKVNPVDFIRDLIGIISHSDTDVEPQGLLDEVINMAACKAAIKAGQPLSEKEIEQLLEDKGKAENSSRCPHGRPTAIKFSITELEKQFKRT
ncbi:MAG: DNA mismatch repair endonuclease MutL [Planctomycetes bacterium]|nr:DNA mismatch repair endonuclease MutL [Planctomycetota bacterium]